MDEYEFSDIVKKLKNNGVTTIGADEQLTNTNIMKLADLLSEDLKKEQYGSMSLPTHRSSARNVSMSSPSTSTSNSKKIQANIDGEKTEVTFSNWKDNDDDEISAQISWGDESHNLVFEPHEEVDDHDTEGSEHSFRAKSEDGKWDFEMSVAVAAGYESGQCNPCIQDYPMLMGGLGGRQHSGIYLHVGKNPDYEEQEEYDKGWYGENAKPLQERFQKLAGIKSLYEQGFDDRLKAAGDFSDEEMDDITSRDIGEPFPDPEPFKSTRASEIIDLYIKPTVKKLSDNELDEFNKEMTEYFLDTPVGRATAKVYFAKKEL